jgi:ABC-type glutathione transport system ATPase component
VRLLARLLDPSDGRIVFAGQELAEIRAERFARTPQRADIQMVFQDPTDSLNPRYSAREAIAEPLRLLSALSAAEIGRVSTRWRCRWACRWRCCRATRTSCRAGRRRAWASRARWPSSRGC